MDCMHDYLCALEDFAKNQDILVKWSTQLHPHTPPTTNPVNRIIVMNSCWYEPRQLPFQLAHEISHILHKDGDFKILYSGTRLKSRFEYEAHKTAIELLVNLYMQNTDNPRAVNYTAFEETFGIPSKLDSVVREGLKNYIEDDR